MIWFQNTTTLFPSDDCDLRGGPLTPEAVDICMNFVPVSVTSAATFAISTQMQWTSLSAKNESLWEDSAFTAVPKQMQLILVFLVLRLNMTALGQLFPDDPVRSTGR